MRARRGPEARHGPPRHAMVATLPCALEVCQGGRFSRRETQRGGGASPRVRRPWLPLTLRSDLNRNRQPSTHRGSLSAGDGEGRRPQLPALDG